jgi:hypothetical protein
MRPFRAVLMPQSGAPGVVLAAHWCVGAAHAHAAECCAVHPGYGHDLSAAIYDSGSDRHSDLCSVLVCGPDYSFGERLADLLTQQDAFSATVLHLFLLEHRLRRLRLPLGAIRGL